MRSSGLGAEELAAEAARAGQEEEQQEAALEEPAARLYEHTYIVVEDIRHIVV